MTGIYYERLGIAPDADQDEIKQAWMEAAKETHPDHNSNPNAQQEFIQIKEAYDVLSDPELRKRYDSLGHEEFVGDRHHSTSEASQAAYQRDRTHEESSDEHPGRQERVDWRANSRNHEAAKHVWKPGSGPTANTAPPTSTADASFAKRVVAYGSLVIIPAILSIYLTAGWTSGLPEYGIQSGIDTGAFILTATVMGILILLITGAEWLLDTDRRLTDLFENP